MCTFNSDLEAQIDNISWSSFRVRANLDDRTRLDIRPIFRFNEDFSNYQNMSIDFSVNRSLGNKWAGQFLVRQWMIPDNVNNVFLWFDIGHAFQIPKLYLKMYNRVRLHWALDVQGEVLQDFIRIQSRIAADMKSKFIPFISVEPWWQLNGVGKLRRIRIEPGINWKMGEDLSFELIFRRQRNLGLPTSAKQNHYVTTLTYNL